MTKIFFSGKLSQNTSKENSENFQKTSIDTFSKKFFSVGISLLFLATFAFLILPPILFSIFHNSTLSLIIIFVGFIWVIFLSFLITKPSKKSGFRRIVLYAFFTKLPLNARNDFIDKIQRNTIVTNNIPGNENHQYGGQGVDVHNNEQADENELKHQNSAGKCCNILTRELCLYKFASL